MSLLRNMVAHAYVETALLCDVDVHDCLGRSLKGLP